MNGNIIFTGSSSSSLAPSRIWSLGASTSKSPRTTSLYLSKATARLTAIVLLPSVAPELVIKVLWGAPFLVEKRRLVLNERIDSDNIERGSTAVCSANCFADRLPISGS